MCPPLAANCQVTGEFPVLIMPNLVLRVPCLSVCHKVCDYELLMLTESEAKLLMVPTCSKVTLETTKKKKLPCCLCYGIYIWHSFQEKTSDFKEVSV